MLTVNYWPAFHSPAVNYYFHNTNGILKGQDHRQISEKQSFQTLLSSSAVCQKTEQTVNTVHLSFPITSRITKKLKNHTLTDLTILYITYKHKYTKHMPLSLAYQMPQCFFPVHFSLPLFTPISIYVLLTSTCTIV